ncbi:helix-turn-helix transcriptional regulator [Actinocrispum wychmicini]|uniref:AraC-like DNA-binding protein n=1 Tax=Actinocrispum wychmicini TaxID=1213861 RepID=A0A4R2JE04_9PSEU|nr:AraC family transcriptional regulator [Actinocrispum wychmicini]TCO55096.1 AraC-like DNA-binding protein [Actinocrispum wychmicini]
MDWAQYWRAPGRDLEAMHAHFEEHVYHRHSHETYSFGVTELGAQSFTCRGAARVSAAGMVMAFNPDEPHDGRATTDLGFTYKIVHIGTALVTGVLSDVTDRPTGLPLFTAPVLDDEVLADALRRLHRALSAGTLLAQDEALTATVHAMVRRGADQPVAPQQARSVPAGVRRARDLLHSAYATDISATDLAEVAGCSRFALHRAFTTTYGMPPSDYQRQLRLRAARKHLTAGKPPAETATEVGFADQSHLTRWFRRYYGLTPGAYAAAHLVGSHRAV